MGLGLLLELPTQRENVELARRAEAAGFDSVWAPEFHNHSGPIALAGAALETDSVELGTAIAWAFGRSPLLTAVTALDLDELSGGRFVLGLGTGTRRMRTDWLGADGDRPAQRLRETVEAIRAVWAAVGGRRGGVRGRADPAARPPVRPRRAGPPQRAGLPRRRERGHGPDGRRGRRRSRVPSDGDGPLHRRGHEAGDRAGRGSRRTRRARTWRSPTGCWWRPPTTSSRRARTPSGRSPSTRPCGRTTGSSTSTGSRTPRRRSGSSGGASISPG